MRPESATTTIIRARMDASLAEVNAALVAAGEKRINAKHLSRTKSRIRARDKQPRRRGGGRYHVPAPGSFAEFVTRHPYDMPAKEVWKLACDAGFSCTDRAVYKARADYPNLRRRHKSTGNQPAPRAKPVPNQARASSKPPMHAEPTALLKGVLGGAEHAPGHLQSWARDQKRGALRAQLGTIVMRLGIDAVEDMLADFKTINAKFEKES